MDVLRRLLITACLFPALSLPAQTEKADSIDAAYELSGVEVRSRKVTASRMKGAQMGFEMNRDELFKAACCNLGESFQNNPSVDVNYSDAATGAKQIRLLGLSGTYVQMLTETQPNFMGAAKPFSLGYVPGPWMGGISVSKGASSVKNGYEGIAGMLNVQYLPPEDDEGATVNLYGDNDSRIEANADANIHLNALLSTEILLHYDENWGGHDGNGDTFMDKPDVRQFNAQNRWAYLGRQYIFHGGVSALKEDRTFGQATHHAAASSAPWVGKIGAERYELYMKHAVVLDAEYGSNVALLTNFALHNQDNSYGERYYDVRERDLTAQLVFETHMTEAHLLSVGANLESHWLKPSSSLADVTSASYEGYGSLGGYAQYTYNWHDRVILMAGLRADGSTHAEGENALFLTPRAHLKWQLADWLQLRASAGKGYRLVNAFWAENNNLLAMGRKIDESFAKRESAWNFGGILGFDLPLFGKNLKLNLEYFYTNFQNQTVVDYDTDTSRLLIYDLDSELNGTSPKSYSHVVQVDATYEPFHGLAATLAFRRNIVKTTYGGVLMDKALSSKYKGLFTFSYKPGLGLWQFDGSLQLNGPARLPKSSAHDGTTETSVYPQLALQVTRWFRHFSVYIGGENLTDYRQKDPIIGSDDPFGMDFDATQVWAPVHGRMFYGGIRVNMGHP